MKDELNGYVTSVPQMARNGNKIYGTSFDIYEMKDGKIISGIDAPTGKPADIKHHETILKRITPVESLPGVLIWAGKARYNAFDSMKEALEWKYFKVSEAFASVERKAESLLKAAEERKEQVGFYVIEDKYPELIL